VNHINYKNASMLLMVQRLLERQGDLTFINPKCVILGVEVTDLNCLPYCKCTLEEDPWHKYAKLLPLKKEVTNRASRCKEKHGPLSPITLLLSSSDN
jgi:hypothetical protein